MVRLVELFDRSAPWEWENSITGVHTAMFEVAGVNYMVGFNEYKDLLSMNPAMNTQFPTLQHEDVWLAGFAAEIDGQWRQDTVGGNDASTVSTVILTFLQIVRAFLEEKQPPVLAIPAVKDRERIYAQISKRVGAHAKELGYTFSGKEETTFPEYGQSVVFYFVRGDLT